MGRRKIEIQPITHERNRSVTFLKRKTGLFKKAYELGVLCSVDVTVIIFEKPGTSNERLYEYCSTDPDAQVAKRIAWEGDRDARAPADFAGRPSQPAKEGQLGLLVPANDDDDDGEGDGDVEDDDSDGEVEDRKPPRVALPTPTPSHHPSLPSYHLPPTSTGLPVSDQRLSHPAKRPRKDSYSAPVPPIARYASQHHAQAQQQQAENDLRALLAHLSPPPAPPPGLAPDPRAYAPYAYPPRSAPPYASSPYYPGFGPPPPPPSNPFASLVAASSGVEWPVHAPPPPHHQPRPEELSSAGGAGAASASSGPSWLDYLAGLPLDVDPAPPPPSLPTPTPTSNPSAKSRKRPAESGEPGSRSASTHGTRSPVSATGKESTSARSVEMEDKERDRDRGEKAAKKRKGGG